MGLLRDSLTSPSRHGCTCAAPHNFGETDWPQPPRSRLSSELHTEQQPEKPQLRRDDAVERDRGCSGRAAPSRCQVFALLGFLQRFDIPVSSRRPAVWKPALRTHTCVSRPAPPPTSGSQGSHVTPCPTGTLTLTRPRVTHHLPTTTRGCCSPSCCQRMPAPPAPAHPVPSLSQCPQHTHVHTHTHAHTRPRTTSCLPRLPSFQLCPLSTLQGHISACPSQAHNSSASPLTHRGGGQTHETLEARPALHRSHPGLGFSCSDAPCPGQASGPSPPRTPGLLLSISARLLSSLRTAPRSGFSSSWTLRCDQTPPLSQTQLTGSSSGPTEVSASLPRCPQSTPSSPGAPSEQSS